jgi:hypothetical protein
MFSFFNRKPKPNPAPKEKRSHSPTTLNYVPDDPDPPRSFLGRAADAAYGAAISVGQRVRLVKKPEPQPQRPILPPPLTADDKSNIDKLCGLMAVTLDQIHDDYHIRGQHPVTFTAAFLCGLFSIDPTLNTYATRQRVGQFMTTNQIYNAVIPPIQLSRQRLSILLDGVDSFVKNLQTHHTITYPYPLNSQPLPSHPRVLTKLDENAISGAKRLMEHVKYQLALNDFDSQQRERMVALASEGGRSKRVKRSKRSKRVKRSKRSSTKRH